ncbi:MAG: hypothetical protein KDC12_00410 [Flavobacteriales bacterium]|nr:hypothetical protein [Flavobacteriales bacterium]
METEHTLYRQFQDEAMADMLCTMLTEGGVEFQRSIGHPEGDVEELIDIHQIHIPSDQVDRADQLVEERANKELESVDKDYFIFSFSEEELREVIIKSHEWSPLDVALAVKILKDKGVELDVEDVKAVRNKHQEASARQTSLSSGNTVLLYISALGAIVGIIAGAYVLLASIQTYLGHTIKKYDNHSRRHGRITLALSVFFTCLYFLMWT